MEVYFGGCEYPKALNKLHDQGVKKVMFSYAAKPSARVWNMAKEFEMEVLLDSGAFSAWSRGKEITVQDYGYYLSKWKPEKYFCLDVIGDPKATQDNQKYLESIGFKPIPVFHMGEPFELLDDLVKKYVVVGLGGTVGKPHTERRMWLSQVYSRHPEGKFHGLGITHHKLMTSYPFDSVDSTWWLAMFSKRRVRENQAEEQENRIKHLLDMAKISRPYYQMSF